MASDSSLFRHLPAPVAFGLLQAALALFVWCLLSVTNCRPSHLPSLPLLRPQQGGPFPEPGSVPISGRTGDAVTQTGAGLRIAERCEAGDAADLASRFLALNYAAKGSITCRSWRWLAKLHELSPAGNKAFLDVGCGRGFASAAFFGLWAPQLGFTPSSLLSWAPYMPCPECNECAERLSLTVAPASQLGLRVLCVEREPDAYAHLAEARRHFLASVHGVQWRLVHAAVSNASGHATAAACPGGDNAACTLGREADEGSNGAVSSAAAADVVPVVTVDQLLSLHQLQRVEVLKIEAQGDELAVLGGALGSLAAGRVGVLVFGYSAKGAWRRPGRLGDAVARLDELGYACFLQGKQTPDGSLARLTGCWQPSYEAHAPGSVLCVPRTHELYPHVERMSLRYALYRTLYREDGKQDTAPGKAAAATAAMKDAALPAQGTLNRQAVNVALPALGAKPGSQQAEAASRASGDEQPSQAGSPVESRLLKWAAAPDVSTFQTPHSRCLLHGNGTVQLAQQPVPRDTAADFLFDTSTMPTRDAACAHCTAAEPKSVPPCCGVCMFAERKCSDFFPGEQRSATVADFLVRSGFNLPDFTPCELFQRIRGRTLWFMGDSHMWNFYYSAECFLREFAPSLRRTPPTPSSDANQRMLTVRSPAPYPPICLDLVLGTRVCVVRVDAVKGFIEKVLPTLQTQLPTFRSDILVYNFGQHYPDPGRPSAKPGVQQLLVRGLQRLAAWRREHRAELPAFVWMDTPVQHFDTPDGSYPGGAKPFTCSRLHAWYDGDPAVLAGGSYNAAAAPLLPGIADAHLKTWNATAPLWRSHWADECTHWCHPSAYQLWLYLLAETLQRRPLGNQVTVIGGHPKRPAPAAAAAGQT